MLFNIISGGLRFGFLGRRQIVTQLGCTSGYLIVHWVLWILVFSLCFDHAFKTSPSLLVVIRFICALLEVLYFHRFFSSRD